MSQNIFFFRVQKALKSFFFKIRNSIGGHSPYIFTFAAKIKKIGIYSILISEEIGIGIDTKSINFVAGTTCTSYGYGST